MFIIFPGFSTHTLGVKSNCRLKNMPTPHKFPANYTIEVIPSLPTVTIETTVAQSGHISVTNDNYSNTNISLYNGESTDCKLKITNTSNVAIEYLDLSIQVSRAKYNFTYHNFQKKKNTPTTASSQILDNI